MPGHTLPPEAPLLASSHPLIEANVEVNWRIEGNQEYHKKFISVKNVTNAGNAQKRKAGVQLGIKNKRDFWTSLQGPTTWRAGWMTNKWPFCHYPLNPLQLLIFSLRLWNEMQWSHQNVFENLSHNLSNYNWNLAEKTASMIMKNCSSNLKSASRKHFVTASNDFEKNSRNTETREFM